MPVRESRDVADIHQRLDSITRQIEQISRPAPRQDLSRQDLSRQDLSRQDLSRQDMSRGEPAVQTTLADNVYLVVQGKETALEALTKVQSGLEEWYKPMAVATAEATASS